MLPMHPALADERIRDLHATADRYRLSALARGNQPTAWQRATTRAHTARIRLATWIRRGQLGPAPNYCTTC